jgi:alpha-1,3-rhamnosyl/mannosyltransferase
VRHPEWHPIDRVKYLEKYLLKQLSKVDVIITISEFSKKEIVSLTEVNPDKVFVTPLGVDPSFSPGGDRIKGLPDQYILYVGNLEPRKNLPTLLTAFQSLPRHLKERHSLVIAGAKGWLSNGLRKVLHSFENDNNSILTGYVPQSHLPDLYRGASLFVYPSFYEGFGLPVIEAMACGVPVVASNTTSLPEVVGDGGILVNPYHPDELKEAMLKLLEDPGSRKEMAEKGLERAKLFSWEKCAHGTFAVYQKVLDAGR